MMMSCVNQADETECLPSICLPDHVPSSLMLPGCCFKAFCSDLHVDSSAAKSSLLAPKSRHSNMTESSSYGRLSREGGGFCLENLHHTISVHFTEHAYQNLNSCSFLALCFGNITMLVHEYEACKSAAQV